MFKKGWANETQVLAWVYSYDGVHSPEPLAITAASAALAISGENHAEAHPSKLCRQQPDAEHADARSGVMDPHLRLACMRGSRMDKCCCNNTLIVCYYKHNVVHGLH